MRTPIDTYIDDSLDNIPGTDLEAGYTSSRDVDDMEVDRSDVAFNRHSFGDEAFPAGQGQVQIGTDGIEVELIQGINEPNFREVCSHAIAAATGRDPSTVEWEEMLSGGLQTALETQVLVFGVRGVSRACTHQIVRTRKGAYHQQSQRARYYGDEPELRMAESVWANPAARTAALAAIYYAHRAYTIAAEQDISYQDARLILPEGTTNWILCEYPLRTFLDTYAYRACSMFQWEIQHVFRVMKDRVVEDHPWMEPYIKISCEKTKGALDAPDGFADDDGVWHDNGAAAEHHCTYQGHENVEGQCDFLWARDSNRSFNPRQAHKIMKEA